MEQDKDYLGLELPLTHLSLLRSFVLFCVVSEDDYEEMEIISGIKYESYIDITNNIWKKIESFPRKSTYVLEMTRDLWEDLYYIIVNGTYGLPILQKYKNLLYCNQEIIDEQIKNTKDMIYCILKQV